MAQQFERVRPGDLIKSDLFNRMMATLESLEGRVIKLESASTGGGSNPGKVVITEPNAAQTFHIGEPLNIIGKNFGLPSQNVVTIEEKTIATFENGSHEQLLIIKSIPNVQDIPQDGREVTLLLSNAIGNATTTFKLAQPPITKPTGTLKSKLNAPPAETIVENKSFTFGFEIAAITTMDDKYTIVPAVDLGWKAEYVDDAGTPIKPSELSILKGPQPTVATIHNVKIRVAVPSGVAPGTTGKLTLTVTSKLNPELTDKSDVALIKVGSQTEADKIGITLSGVVTPGKKSGNDIEIPLATGAGKNVTAIFTVTLDKAGLYKIATPTFSPNPGNIWTAELITITPAQLAAPEDSIKVKVKVPVTGAVSTNMTLSVVHSEDASIKGDRDIKILMI